MLTPLRGNAWVFGGGVTTDDILPGKYLDRANEEVGQFAMSGIDPEFAKKVRPGDFVVAGHNFGAGSGRESAPIALMRAGIAAVVALGYSRLFFRNCINLGLPVAIVDAIDGIATGDGLTFDLEARTVVHDRTRASLPVRNLTGTSFSVLQAGGIVAFTKLRLKKT